MYKGKKILGISMARGGSKGIPKKNIKMLAGKPLIAYSIEAAKKSKYLTRYIVSSEDEEIIQIAKEYGASVPFVRPKELAGDEIGDTPVLKHAIKWMRDNEAKQYDYIMMLHPTAPLRLAEDIDGCINKIVDSEADSVMSMKHLTDFSLKKLKVIKDDLILPFREPEGKTTKRRQDAEKEVYKRNCAIYLTKTELIMQDDLFGSVSRPYLMPEIRSIDINEIIDFEIAEYIITKLRKEGYDY